MGAQCGAVVGLHPRNKEWLSGDRMHGVWYGDARGQRRPPGRDVVRLHGDYEALAVSPLTSGRIDNPDICLIYGTPVR